MTSFSEMTVAELKAAAKSVGLKGYSKMLKADLVALLTQEQKENTKEHGCLIVDESLTHQSVLEEKLKRIPLIIDHTGFVDNDENQVQIVSPLNADEVDDEKVTITRGTNNSPMRVLNRAQRRRLAARYRKGFIKKPEFMA